MLSNISVFRTVIDGFSIPAGYFYNVLDNPIISILYNVLDNPIISILYNVLDNPIISILYNVLDNPIISILYNVLDNPIISISIYLHNIMHRINVIQKWVGYPEMSRLSRNH